MLHVGLDLSRTRLDVHVMNETGAPVLVQRLKDWGLRLADHSRRACPLLGVARRSMPGG